MIKTASDSVEKGLGGKVRKCCSALFDDKIGDIRTPLNDISILLSKDRKAERHFLIIKLQRNPPIVDSKGTKGFVNHKRCLLG